MRTTIGWMLLVVLAGGCRCGSGEPAAPRVTLGHFARWDALVEAAAHADYDDAAILARELTGGEPATHPAGEEAAAGVAGALGFVSFAEDPAELALAVARAARGCGACHVAAGVEAPPPPPWSHESGAARAVDGLVWDRGADPPPAGDEEALQAVRSAWKEHAAGVERVQAVIATCAACHAD